MTFLQRLRDFIDEEYPGAASSLVVRLQIRYLIEAIEDATAPTQDDHGVDPADLYPHNLEPE